MPKTPVSVSAPALRAAREDAGLSITKAAKALGLAHSTLVGWESGQSQPVVSRLPELAQLYGVPMAQLLDVEGQRPTTVLAGLRVAAGLLQRDVGAAVGVSGEHYGMIERGARPVPNHWIAPLSELFDIPTATLATLLSD
ncbi:helix-turn-helix domain-containing protein [Paenarthrobacter ureafaciens]|uniref:helix-turn-helix domain-containing protein n=1 Tax=Paenarthrobacter ureafaciens TaxID=37931 RepID=UPI0034DB5A1B